MHQQDIRLMATKAYNAAMKAHLKSTELKEDELTKTKRAIDAMQAVITVTLQKLGI